MSKDKPNLNGIHIIDYPDFLPSQHFIPKETWTGRIKHYDKIKAFSMGCRVEPPTCPACEAGMPTHHPSMVQIDYAALEMRILAGLGISKDLFELYEKGQVSKQTLLAHTHDSLDVETEGVERFLGVDYGKDGGTVAVVIKRSSPNRNGDVFEIEAGCRLPAEGILSLSEPKFVGKLTKEAFQREYLCEPPPRPVPAEKKHPTRVKDRIKAMTEQYIGVLRNDPHHVPQTTQKWGTPLIQKVMPDLLAMDFLEAARREIQKINQRVDEHVRSLSLAEVEWPIPSNIVAYLKNRQVELASRLKTCDETKDAEALWEIKREMYQLYREQQRVEALLALRKEAEVKAVMFRVHLEHGDHFLELRAKNRDGQTICYSRLVNADSPGSWKFGDVVEGLLAPFCASVKEKTTERVDYEIINKSIHSLIERKTNHPRETFIIDCCIEYSKQLMAEYVRAENIETWEREVKKFRNHAKSIPYPVVGRDRSKEFQSALKHVSIKGEIYSSATQEAVKKLEEERPKQVVEQQVAKHEAEKAEKELKERTALFQPRHCHRCGTDQGCMCPRTPAEPHKDPCQHPFLVLIPHNIARELGVTVITLKPETRIYACRECQMVFLPFELNGGVKYVPYR